MKSIAKWTSTFALTLSLVAWWFSANYFLGMPFDATEAEDIQIEINAGFVYTSFYIPLRGSLPDTTDCYPVRVADADWGWELPHFVRRSMPPKLSQSDPDWYFEAGLPLWIPTAIFALITALLWKSSPKCIAPGHCAECDYDLTGNASGVCSECGEKSAMKPPPASV